MCIRDRNYPGTPTTGDPIDGSDSAEALPDVRVLHAGTTTNADGQVVSSGGRVLSVVARGANLDVARARAYHCLLYTSPSPRDRTRSRMPSSA